jgi:hypothetical protein
MLQGLLLCSSAKQLPIRAHKAPGLFARFPSKLYAMDSPIALQPSRSPGMKELMQALTKTADCADASVLVSRGATNDCMAVMQRLQDSQGLRTSGGGGGGGGAGLAWQVLNWSQPSTPPMQRQTEAVTSPLQNWSGVQSESRMQVDVLGTPAGSGANRTARQPQSALVVYSCPGTDAADTQVSACV